MKQPLPRAELAPGKSRVERPPALQPAIVKALRHSQNFNDEDMKNGVRVWEGEGGGSKYEPRPPLQERTRE